MTVVDLSISKRQEELNKTDYVSDTIRQRVLDYSKAFKTSWVGLGQALYAVYEDKLFHGWGHEKFEHYTEQEVGLKKEVATRLLKTYIFLEGDEPAFFKEGFVEEREVSRLPGYDELNVLDLAKGKKELPIEDYNKLKKGVFEDGKYAGEVRKDLSTMMKERAIVDPEQEREDRNRAAVKKLISSIKTFKKDAESLKLIPHGIVVEADELLEKLQSQID